MERTMEEERRRREACSLVDQVCSLVDQLDDMVYEYRVDYGEDLYERVLERLEQRSRF